VILTGNNEGSIKLCQIKRKKRTERNVGLMMFIIVQIEGEPILENLHVMPNAVGNKVEVFSSKEDAYKLLELLWDIDPEEQEENDIHIWRLH
jgi:hypothetical protein